ncbi:hypothetical protein OM416_09445, partial [Paenibacillus sp. LS1]|uniref:hypothetical protein n=1 Tax=Paenibacillus sp. LS1 TaxID=2992120 RepID=UPI002231FE22
CDDRQMHALAEAFMDKLKNIVSHCIEVNTSEQASSHAMGKEKYGAELLDPQKFHRNTDYPVLNSYAPSVLQQLFIRTADTVVMEKIELQGSRTKKEMIEACHQIIRMQSALRSSYRMDSLVGTISEHELNHAWHMPYIDLRYASLDERNAVSQQINKLSYIEFNERSSQLLVKLVIVRNAERQHTIHIIAHHSVWDKTSTVIFKEMLDEGSMMNTPPETLLPYSQYIADKHKHNDLFKGSGLTLPGNMEKWIPVLHEYMDHNVSNEISQSVASVIPLGPHLLKVYKEKPWDLLMHAVQIIAKENGLIPPSSKKIPVFILQEDRAYTAGSYSQVMGEFLDMLPIMVQEAGESGLQSIQEQVEQIQKAKREQSIHYLELVHEIEEQLMSWLPSLLSVNFQAAFDLSYEDFKNMMTLDHYRTTNEIFVNRFADSLVIYYPLYSKRQVNLNAVLQKEFEWLEQSLASMTTSM